MTRRSNSEAPEAQGLGARPRVRALTVAAMLLTGCTLQTQDCSNGSGSSDAGTGVDSSVSDAATPPASNLSAAEIAGLVSSHNDARAAAYPHPATAMPALTWSDTLASDAAAAASRCEFTHSNNGHGENLFASSVAKGPSDVVGSWTAEAPYYQWNTNTCETGHACGDYTQVVWANTTRLGCAKQDCTTGSPFGSGAWQLWVCNYDPPGNYNGQAPYVPGSNLSATEISDLVARHNAARASVVPQPTTPLPDLTWSATLESDAAAWANRCEFAHSGNGHGENLYASSGTSSSTDMVVGSWVAEAPYYHFDTKTCESGQVCGHYTQVVWRTTSRVGCAKRECATGSPFGSGPWTLWVCDYDPPGNYVGQDPY